MARKPTKTEPLDTQEVTPETQARVAEIHSTGHALMTAHSQERDLINQLLGQAQAAEAIKKISQTIGISKLIFVKENKLYRALAGTATPDGRELSGTWEEFCSLLGISDQKANIDIENFKAFGEEALESMTQMGIGYRQMRELRKLPDGEKDALIEVARSGDKDSFIDLAEEIISKHHKEKESYEQQLQEAHETIEAKEAVLADKNRNIDSLQEKVSRIKKMKPDELTHAFKCEAASHLNKAEEMLRVQVREALIAVHGAAEEHGDAEALEAARDWIRAQVELLEKAVADVRTQSGCDGLEWENA